MEISILFLNPSLINKKIIDNIFFKTYIPYSIYFSVQLYAKEASTKVEPITAEQISFDNRVRQFGTPDQVFNYFSSIQLVNKFGI